MSFFKECIYMTITNDIRMINLKNLPVGEKNGLTRNSYSKTTLHLLRRVFSNKHILLWKSFSIRWLFHKTKKIFFFLKEYVTFLRFSFCTRIHKNSFRVFKISLGCHLLLQWQSRCENIFTNYKFCLPVQIVWTKSYFHRLHTETIHKYKKRIYLEKNTKITANFWVVGHSNSTFVVVRLHCYLSRTPRAMSEKERRYSTETPETFKTVFQYSNSFFTISLIQWKQ